MAIFRVIIKNNKDPFQSPFLPMDRYEAEQLLYDMGLDAPGAEHGMELLMSSRGLRLDPGTDLRALNRLAQRMEDMREGARNAFLAWGSTQGACTVEAALKAAYQAKDWFFMDSIGSDEELGEFALDNDMLEDYNALPDDIYAALDRTKAGALMREQEGGVFANGGYLIASYDAGEGLLAEEPLPLFQVSFSDGRVRESDWAPLPMTAEEESKTADFFESDSLDGLHMVCRSTIPQLNGIVSGADELLGLRLLNEALTGMSGEDILKYKALLEVVQPGAASAALRLADTMGYYDVTLEYTDPANYGLQHAAYKYGLDAGCRLLDYVDLAGYGTETLRTDGYEATRYGAVYRNAMAQKFLAGPNTIYSGDFYCGRTEGFPTCVCWDPDAQKVWLELNDGAADSELAKDFAYYQGLCEDWGVRCCASQEDFDQVLDELGAQPYDEVMATEDAQGFGGMKGMT